MGHTAVMGIINVTPDSFSDGGRWSDTPSAIAHGLELIAQGARMLDVGGESTRPGSERVSEHEEMERVIPVIEGLRVPAVATGVRLSVDTMRASVAREAVGAGATIVNDVSGGLADEAMLGTVAELGVDYVCQHWRGFGREMDAAADYDDVVTEVRDELSARCRAAVDAGVAAERIIVDPGLGFAKTAEHDWQVLAHLEVFAGLGHRLLVGASRKRFLGSLLSGRPAVERDAATTAVTAWCCQHGIWAVRTHEVRSQVDTITVIEHLMALAGLTTATGQR